MTLLRHLHRLPDEEAKWPKFATMGLKQLDFFEDAFDILLIYDEESAANELVAKSFAPETLRSADHSHAKLAAEQLRLSLNRYIFVLDFIVRGHMTLGEDGEIMDPQPWEIATKRDQRAARDFLDRETLESRRGRWAVDFPYEELKEGLALFQ